MYENEFSLRLASLMLIFGYVIDKKLLTED